MTNKYTEKLIQQSEERKRLTNQLAVLVGNVAKDIANNTHELKRVKVEGVGVYGIMKIHTHISTDPLVFVQGDNQELHFFVSGAEPESVVYLHNDRDAEVSVASKEEYLTFANNIPKIVAAFELEIDQTLYELRKTFEYLKTISKQGGVI